MLTLKLPAVFLLLVLCPSVALSQLSPGPYEILPFEDAYIIEGWKDLLGTSQIADWTGWKGSSWIVPHPYNGHTGSDYAMDTGTPIYAPKSGTVISLETTVPEDQHSSSGNYVRLRLDGHGPLGESLEFVAVHLLPNVPVSVGQAVTTGEVIGFSDNTGNSTSEHLHFQNQTSDQTTRCPYFHAHFKYPIMFNPSASHQVGHVVRVITDNTPVRMEPNEGSPSLTTVFPGQMYFSSYWQRGHYRIFLPNDSSNRSGWVKATEVTEVFAGTVIQALPDSVSYVHEGTLASPYPVRSASEDSADVITPMMHLDPDNEVWLKRALRMGQLMRDLWTGRNERGRLQFKSTYFTVARVDDSAARACSSPSATA